MFPGILFSGMGFWYFRCLQLNQWCSKTKACWRICKATAIACPNCFECIVNEYFVSSIQICDCTFEQRTGAVQRRPALDASTCSVWAEVRPRSEFVEKIKQEWYEFHNISMEDEIKEQFLNEPHKPFISNSCSSLCDFCLGRN